MPTIRCAGFIVAIFVLFVGCGRTGQEEYQFALANLEREQAKLGDIPRSEHRAAFDAMVKGYVGCTLRELNEAQERGDLDYPDLKLRMDEFHTKALTAGTAEFRAVVEVEKNSRYNQQLERVERAQRGLKFAKQGWR